ncbi:MAG: DEAD/DEAH box helicase [Spirochaetaceae bacterium]|jgi:SNF2 family DNA or RNA helicase/uncharacterized Zn finger protein|nr:DEAD/DEAH box helicase [Spirochaetaceae bacterium]
MSKTPFGTSPWGRWFVEVLDSYHLENRLERGKSYASTGKVSSLEINGNKIRAKVKGHYNPFYNVSVTFPLFDQAEKDKIINLIEEDNSLLAEIAAGELPENFLKKLKKNGVYLIPKKWEEMKRSCNCPDGVSICKHIAALYYVLSREVDADPHILFKLRGLDLTEIASQKGASLDNSLEAPFKISTIPEQEIRQNNGEQKYRVEAFPSCISLISTLLPPHPAFLSERDFSILLTQFYHESGRFYQWGLSVEVSDEEEHRASRSQWTIQAGDLKVLSPLFLVQETVQGTIIKHDIYDAFLKFRTFSTNDGTESFIFLRYLFAFLNTIIASGAFIPYPIVERGKLVIVWLVYDKLKEIHDSLSCFYSFKSKLLPVQTKKETSRGYVMKGAGTFADGESLANLISCSVLTEFVRRSAFSINSGGVKTQNFVQCFFQGFNFEVTSPASRSIPLAIKRWLAVLYTDFSAYQYRISLKNKSAGRKKSGGDESPDEVKFSINFEVKIDDTFINLKDAVKQGGSLDILKAPTALSNYLPEIRDLFTKTSIVLKEERLVYFLDYAADLLSRIGIEILLPKKLYRSLSPRLVVHADSSRSSSSVSYINMDNLLNFSWQVALGDMVLSRAEFEALLAQKSPVVRFKNQFVRIDAEKLSGLFKKIENDGKDRPDPQEFFREYLSGNTVLSVSAQEIMNKLMEAKNYAPPSWLQAKLREYQYSGYNWVLSLLMTGFGAILADDMGLGKTIQAIAVLLRLKEEGLLTTGALVIAPAALLLNWEREFAAFAPNLKITRYHGKGRTLTTKSDCILTTYQTAVRDFNTLNENPFSLMIVDEAHLMKNEDTRLSKTVKKLRSQYRLALSGTPVENRLEDMRSLFDYIIPGFLGSKEQFKKEFQTPIELERRRDKAEYLRKITSPFLLRRLKTDKKIISDLPDKIICNEYASLEKEQAALYQSILNENLEKIEQAGEARERSTLVLSLLTALKQVCDHPRVYDKESPCSSTISGKAALFMTLLREILLSGEKVLVFSQYVEALHCLQKMIVDELGEQVLLYYGAMTQKARSDVIDQFQNEGSNKIMLISLKAGGLGLNLTAASRVIHYDLWYNPAVEAQATDRAFRIGQKRNVFVHRLITKNTFEEKIDAMLTSKKELAEMSVGTGESWLSKMSNKELAELFSRS